MVLGNTEHDWNFDVQSQYAVELLLNQYITPPFLAIYNRRDNQSLGQAGAVLSGPS